MIGPHLLAGLVSLAITAAVAVAWWWAFLRHGRQNK